VLRVVDTESVGVMRRTRMRKRGEGEKEEGGRADVLHSLIACCYDAS